MPLAVWSKKRRKDECDKSSFTKFLPGPIRTSYLRCHNSREVVKLCFFSTVLAHKDLVRMAFTCRDTGGIRFYKEECETCIKKETLVSLISYTEQTIPIRYTQYLMILYTQDVLRNAMPLSLIPCLI